MAKRLDHAIAVIARRHISARALDCAPHSLHCIRRTGDPTCMRAVEHRKIIVVVACREDGLAVDAAESSQFRERRAFAVILMAEPHIDRIAHEMEARNPRALLLKKNANAIHVRIRKRDQPNSPPSHLDHLRAGNFLEKFLDVRDQFQ